MIFLFLAEYRLSTRVLESWTSGAASWVLPLTGHPSSRTVWSGTHLNALQSFSIFRASILAESFNLADRMVRALQLSIHESTVHDFLPGVFSAICQRVPRFGQEAKVLPDTGRAAGFAIFISFFSSLSSVEWYFQGSQVTGYPFLRLKSLGMIVVPA